MDPETDDVYISNGWNEILRYSGLTGRYNGRLKDGRIDPILTTDVAVSPDGFVYIQKGPRYSGPYQRLDRDLKSAPLPGANTDSFGWVFGRYGQGYCTKGTAIGYDGRLYSLGMLAWCQYYVVTYGKDGEIINGARWSEDVTKWWAGTNDGDQAPQKGLGLTGALIGPVTAGCGGIKVDRKGFVYVGLNVLSDDFKPPAGFEGDRAYLGDIGCVVKFKPEGGGLPKGKRHNRLADYEEDLRRRSL